MLSLLNLYHLSQVACEPRLECSKLQLNSTTEDWNVFTWYLSHCLQNRNDAASGQLLEWINKQLGNIVLRAHPMFKSQWLYDMLKTLKGSRCYISHSWLDKIQALGDATSLMNHSKHSLLGNMWAQDCIQRYMHRFQCCVQIDTKGFAKWHWQQWNPLWSADGI